MVDLDETDLSNHKKAFRAQALVADIDVNDYEDPDIEQLRQETLALLDELATELQSIDGE